MKSRPRAWHHQRTHQNGKTSCPRSHYPDSRISNIYQRYKVGRLLSKAREEGRWGEGRKLVRSMFSLNSGRLRRTVLLFSLGHISPNTVDHCSQTVVSQLSGGSWVRGATLCLIAPLAAGPQWPLNLMAIDRAVWRAPGGVIVD